MPRVASLFLPHLAIERLRREEAPPSPLERRAPSNLPVDDDPGACSVPRGGPWRPGARWARAEALSGPAAGGAAPAHQQPSIRELGRRSEAADPPFRPGHRVVDTPTPHGDLLDRAALVLVGKVGRQELVTAACPVAMALGLAAGMPATQARAMVPDLDVRPANPAGDEALLHRLAVRAARRWTPIAAASGPDGLWLDLTGASHLFGGEERFCRRVLAFLARAGFTARIAVAGTPGAAHALARFGPGPLTMLAPGGEAAALAPLPLAALRLSPAALEAAGRFGIERVGELVGLPRAPIARRLGLAAVRRLDQALGRAGEPITGVATPEPPVAERRLLEPISTAEAIAQVIADLTRDIADRLRTTGLGARALVLFLIRVDGTEQRVTAGTARATRDAAHVARLLALRIDTIDPGLGIETMRLVAGRTEPLGAQALPAALAAEPAPADLSTLVDILCGRAGPSALFRATSVETDVPERAVRRLPALAEPQGWPEWRRPSMLLRRPEPLSRVVALLPDRPPRRFSWRGEAHEVVAADGPERIHGEWWVRDGEVWAVRDYWRVEDGQGRRYWLFRRGDGVDPATGDLGWWMHGAFG